MRIRSVLFAPGSRPNLILKLPSKGPDVAVLDLEDAVPAGSKPEARRQAKDALSQLDPRSVWLRINEVGSDWWTADLELAACEAVVGVVVPKVGTAAQVAEVAGALKALGVAEPQIIAGIETIRGVLAARFLLTAPVVAAYFGAEDLIADLGGNRTIEGTEVLYARSRVALASRAAGIPLIDQAVVELDNEEAFRRDAEVGRSLGYSGKLCIHPQQVAWANEVFTPSDEEISRSRRLLAAWREAAERDVGSIRFEGEMADHPAVRRAQRLLDLVDPTE